MDLRSPLGARAAPVLAACVLAACVLAACSSDHTPTTPAVSDAHLLRAARATAQLAPAAQEPATGAVYTTNNDLAGNQLAVLRRGTDGLLTLAATYATGGLGSGAFEDSDNGVVLGDDQGESSPNNLTESRQLLFVTNPGSNNVTVYRVMGDGTTLAQADLEPSGGRRPVSITVNRGLVYVLNSGERIFGLSATNCTTGDLPSVTGFHVSAAGDLTPIAGSKRLLSGVKASGCAQASFSADGRFLIVTERFSRALGQPMPDEGVIDVFPVNTDGTLGTPKVFDATGRGPFGFTPTRNGLLLTSQQNGGPTNPGGGGAAAYRVNTDGTLTPTSPTVFNGGTDSCWMIVSDDGLYAYVVSFFGTGRISTYAVGANGSLTLLDATDDDGHAGTGAGDVSLSANSRYLYQLNASNGKVNAYSVGADGRLTFIQAVQVHAPSSSEARLGLAAF